MPSKGIIIKRTKTSGPCVRREAWELPERRAAVCVWYRLKHFFVS